MKNYNLNALLFLSFSQIITSTELLKITNLTNLSAFTGYNNATTNGKNIKIIDINL